MAIAASVSAQDTVLNRSVIVERDFQPIIQDAGKVNVTPQAVQTDIPETQVQYSDFISSQSLAASETT